MDAAYPEVEESKSQYRESKICFYSGAMVMMVMLNDVAKKPDAKWGEELTGLRTELNSFFDKVIDENKRRIGISK